MVIDRDTINWIYWLIIIGVILIALFSGFEFIPFFVRAVGNIFILGALLFLIDIDGGQEFKIYYWSIFVIWSIVLIQTGISYLTVSPEFNEIFTNVLFLVYALVFLSVPLFCQAMRYLCLVSCNLVLGNYWKKVAIFSASFYVLPFLSFIIIFVGRSFGYNIGLHYGINDPNSIFAEPSRIFVRLLLFIPLIIVIMQLYRMRNILFLEVAMDNNKDFNNSREDIPNESAAP